MLAFGGCSEAMISRRPSIHCACRPQQLFTHCFGRWQTCRRPADDRNAGDAAGVILLLIALPLDGTLVRPVVDFHHGLHGAPVIADREIDRQLCDAVVPSPLALMVGADEPAQLDLRTDQCIGQCGTQPLVRQELRGAHEGLCPVAAPPLEFPQCDGRSDKDSEQQEVEEQMRGASSTYRLILRGVASGFCDRCLLGRSSDTHRRSATVPGLICADAQDRRAAYAYAGPMLELRYRIGRCLEAVMSFQPCSVDVVNLPGGASDRRGWIGFPSRKATRVSGGRGETLRVGTSQ